MRIIKHSLFRALSFSCCLVLGMSGASAHDGPEHEIEELTERIAKEGESADLLVQRAIEFKVLGKYSEAVKDLTRALHFESGSLTAQRELSRAYFALGKTNEALEAVTKALQNPADGPEYASLFAVRAEIFRDRKDPAAALDDANRAIREHPINVEWYLLRSQLQADLKLTKERLRGLEHGLRATGSGVLEAEWIEALIEDGQIPLALEKIEAELLKTRWKSSWLIRRAKARLALGSSDDAKSDLEFAIAELDRRLKPSATDPLLLADRGQAFELLGKKEEAKKDYQQAKEKGMTDEWLRARLRALK